MDLCKIFMLFYSSFLVSNVNSLSTVTWEDFVSGAPAFKGINDKQQLTIIKIIGIIYGEPFCLLTVATLIK